LKRARKTRPSLEAAHDKWGWFFVAPAILYFSIFSFYPILYAFWMSLTNKKLLSLKPPTFVGFANYQKVLSSSDFWDSLKNTLEFTVGAFVPLFILSLAFALLISSRKRFQRALQMALYSPAVLSSVVAALIWLIIFDPRGLANAAANALMGTSGKDYMWLSSTSMVKVSTVIVYVWKYVGYFTILFVTGIGKIPASVVEASIIDGANARQRMLRITLPLLRPTTVLVSVMILIFCLKTFSTQYLFTQKGASLRAVNVVTLNIYQTAFRDQNLPQAGVMSILLFILMLVLSYAQLRASRGEEEQL